MRLRAAYFLLTLGLFLPLKMLAKTPEALFSHYQHAVIKITVMQERIPITWGTGFFVDSKGHFATNHHVLRAAIRNPAFHAEFTLADGRKLNSFSLSHCGDTRGLDLCFGQLKIKPRAWFKASPTRPKPGETIYVIGHPQGLDFSISNGIVSALRKSPSGIHEVQISAAISPGNSGGPIFNRQGELVGMVSKFFKDGQNLNFGLQARELADYAKWAGPSTPLSLARQRIAKNLRQRMQKRYEKEIQLTHTLAARGTSPTTSTQFHEFSFTLGYENFALALPKLFETCKPSRDRSGETNLYNCSALSGGIIFSVQKLSSESAESLVPLNGRAILVEKPLPIVESLRQEGLWSKYETSLSALGKRALYSAPSVAKCSLTEPFFTGSFFAPGQDSICRFSVQNDGDIGAISQSLWLQKGKATYGFHLWAEDPEYLEFVGAVPELAAQSLRLLNSAREPAAVRMTSIAKTSDPTKPPPFQIQVLRDYEVRRQAKVDESSTLYLYQRAKDASRMFAVEVINSGLGKENLADAAEELFRGTLEGFAAKVQEDTIESETQTLHNLPGLMHTAVVDRGNRKQAAFHTTVFAKGKTYVLFSFADVSDLKQAARDFVTMTKSFKPLN